MSKTDICELCNVDSGQHDSFCTYAPKHQKLYFFKSQMLESMRKHWVNERRFKEITDSYLNASPTHQFMSQKDKEYNAANDPARKAATANAQYHMARATMYASAINALK